MDTLSSAIQQLGDGQLEFALQVRTRASLLGILKDLPGWTTLDDFSQVHKTT
jgi:hypothetical protein